MRQLFCIFSEVLIQIALWQFKFTRFFCHVQLACLFRQLAVSAAGKHCTSQWYRVSCNANYCT